ncbi:MAG: hypothetical protein NC548_10860 [Lachnospiraceae bacterium]|nr:hypothetical protein [Lachnospiraceae bacterium]
MRKLKQIFAMFAFCLTVFSVIQFTSLTAYASEAGQSNPNQTSMNISDQDVEVFDSGDAIQDIMRDSRFKGAVSSISKITEFVDIWFVRIISLVSFFIISAALLKNACAGAYCANSKFWDKVADAHQKTEAINLAGVKQFFQGGQGIVNTTPGGIRDFFLGIIPNIKAFTDFDDADIEPKAYFMKAIPQMIACVVIGIFIYNGYYRDTAATVGNMGSVLIERTLGSVNPDSFINKIFNTTGWPKSPWDKDKSREGEWKQAVFDELKGIIATNYSDVTSAQQKASAVTNMVTQIQNEFNTAGLVNSASEGGAGEGYIYKMSGISSYASVDTGEMSECPEDGTGNRQGRLVFHMDNIVSASTTMNSSNNVAYVTFTLKKVVDDGATGSSGVNVDGWGATNSGGNTLNLNTDTALVSLDGKGEVKNGQLIVTDPITFSTSQYTDTEISSIENPPGNIMCNKSTITIGAGTYDIDANGKVKLGRLKAGSNKASAESNYVYAAFK